MSNPLQPISAGSVPAAGGATFQLPDTYSQIEGEPLTIAEYIEKPVEELIGIYLGITLPSIEIETIDIIENNAIQNWKESNFDIWGGSEEEKLEELAFYIHLKHALNPFEFSAQETDETIRTLTSLIQDGLDTDSELYTLEELKSTIIFLQEGATTIALADYFTGTEGKLLGSIKSDEENNIVELIINSIMTRDSEPISSTITLDIPENQSGFILNNGSLSFNIAFLPLNSPDNSAEFDQESFALKLIDSEGHEIEIALDYNESMDIVIDEELIDSYLDSDSEFKKDSIASLEILFDVTLLGERRSEIYEGHITITNPLMSSQATPLAEILDSNALQTFLNEVFPSREWSFPKDCLCLAEMVKLFNSPLSDSMAYWKTVTDNPTLLIWGERFYPEYWNVMDTGLIGLTAIRAAALGIEDRETAVISAMESLNSEYTTRFTAIAYVASELLFRNIDSRSAFDIALFELLGSAGDNLDEQFEYLDSYAQGVLGIIQGILEESALLLGEQEPLGNWLNGQFNFSPWTSYREIISSDEFNLDNLFHYGMVLESLGLSQDLISENMTSIITEALTLSANAEGTYEAKNTFQRSVAESVYRETEELLKENGLLSSGIEIPQDISSDSFLLYIVERLHREDTKSEIKEDLDNLFKKEAIISEFTECKTKQDNPNRIDVDFDRVIELAANLIEEYGSNLRDFITDQAVRLLYEGVIARETDISSYTDQIPLEYWQNLVKEGVYTLDDLKTSFKSRAENTPKGEEIMALMANTLAERYPRYAIFNNFDTVDDWTAKEEAGGIAAVDIIRKYRSEPFVVEQLDELFLPFTNLNIEDKIWNAFKEFFVTWTQLSFSNPEGNYTQFLPHSPQSWDAVNRLIALKLKYWPYDSFAVGYIENLSDAITSAGRSSYSAELEGNPYEDTAIESNLIFAYLVRELLSDIVGTPDTAELPTSAEDYLNYRLEQSIEFIFAQTDRESMIPADASGAMDLTYAAAAGTVHAAMDAAERGMISYKRANEIIRRVVEASLDNPYDPNDSVLLDEDTTMAPHYIRPGTDDPSGNSERSLIDTLITAVALMNSRNWQGIELETAALIDEYVDTIDLNNLMYKASANGTAATNNLNYGFTWRGYTKGEPDKINEYIICYLAGIGIALKQGDYQLAEKLSTAYYQELGRMVGEGSSEEDFIYTWENAIFQYMYPLSLMCLSMIHDITSDLTTTFQIEGAAEDLNPLRNAAIALWNARAEALKLLETFRSANMTITGSKPTEFRYVMDEGVQPRGADGGNYYVEGTLSHDAATNALTAAPWLAYSIMRSMDIDYPFQESLWGTRAIDPEKGLWASPAIFSLDKTFAILALEIILGFGDPNKVDSWDLSLLNPEYLNGVLSAGWKEDISPIFYQPYKHLDPSDNSSIEVAIENITTSVDRTTMSIWLEENISDQGLRDNYTQKAEERWALISGTSGEEDLELDRLIKDSYSDGDISQTDRENITDKFTEIIAQASSMNDYNSLATVIEDNFIRSEEPQIELADNSNLDSLLISLMLQLRYGQTKFALNQKITTIDSTPKEADLSQSPQDRAENGLEIAESCIDSMENLIELSKQLDESALLAFQAYTEVENEYYSLALEELNEIIRLSENGILDSDSEVVLKAKALIFVVQFRRFDEDYIPYFANLSQTYNSLDENDKPRYLDIMQSAIAEYLAPDILQKIGIFLHPEDRITEEQYIDINNYIEQSLKDPKSTELAYSPIRERYLSEPFEFNLFDPALSGIVGSFTNPLYFGDSPESEIVLLTAMKESIPVFEATFGKSPDIINNQEDMVLLSLAARLRLIENESGQRVYDDETIIEVLSGERTLNPEQLQRLQDMESISLSTESLEAIDDYIYISHYLSGSEEIATTLSYLLQNNFSGIQGLDNSEWTELFTDLLTTDNIFHYLVGDLVGQLHLIERISISQNSLFTEGATYRYKELGAGRINLQNPMISWVLDAIFSVYEELSELLPSQFAEIGSLPENISPENIEIISIFVETILRDGASIGDVDNLTSASIKAFSSNGINNQGDISALLRTALPLFIYSNNFVGKDNRLLEEELSTYLSLIIETGDKLGLNPYQSETTLATISLLALSIQEEKITIEELPSYYERIEGLSLDDTGDDIEISPEIAAMFIAGLEFAFDKDLEILEEQGIISELLDWLIIPSIAENGKLDNWRDFAQTINMLRKIDIHMQNVHTNIPLIVEEIFNKQLTWDGEGQEELQQWMDALLEAEECRHGFLDFETTSIVDMFRLMSASISDIPRVTTPKTEFAERSAALIPLIKYYYGEDLSIYGDIDELDINLNKPLEALAGFYATLSEDRSLTYVAALLTLGKYLVEGAEPGNGLEALYDTEFDLLTDSNLIGVAGFYAERLQKNAGVDIFSSIIGRIISGSDSLDDIVTTTTRFQAGLDRFILEEDSTATEQILEELGFNDEERDVLLANINSWISEEIDNLEKSLPSLPEAERAILLTERADVLFSNIETGFRVKEKLEARDYEGLRELASSLFMLPDTEEGLLAARAIAENWIQKDFESGSQKSYETIAEITLLSAVITPLYQEVEILTQLRQTFEAEFETLKLADRIDAIWVLSSYATPVIYGLKDISEVQTEIASKGKAFRLLGALLGKGVELIVSEFFTSGLLTSIATNLENPNFKITEDINRDYLHAYFTDLEQKTFIDNTRATFVADGSGILTTLLGRSIDIESNVIHAGYIETLTQRVWELVDEEGLSKDEAFATVYEELSLISTILLDEKIFTAETLLTAVGAIELEDGSRDYTIEDVLQNSDAIGLLSYYAKLIAPITDQEVKEITEDPRFEQIKGIISDMQIGRISGQIPGYNYLLNFPLPRNDDDLAKMIIFWERYTGKEFTMTEMPEGTSYYSHIEDYKNFGTDAVTFSYIELEAIRFIRNICGTYDNWIKASVLGKSADASTAWGNFIFTLIRVSNALEPQTAISLDQSSVLLSNFDQAGYLTNQSENAMQIGLNAFLEIARSSDPYEESFNGFLSNKGIDAKNISNFERLKLQIEFEATEEGSSLLWGGISDEELKSSDAYTRQRRSQPGYQELMVEFLEGQELTAYIKNGQLYIQSYTVEGPYAPSYETTIAIDPLVAKEMWFDWMLTNGFDPMSPTAEQYAKLEKFKSRTVTVGGGPTTIRVHPRRSEYYEAFEEAYKEQLEGLFNKSALELAIDYGIKVVSDRLAIAAELKPLVEQARFMDIDMLDPYQSGIVFYYVAEARIYGLDKVKEILNAEIAARVTLDDYTIDYSNPNAVGLLGWFANEPEVTLSMVRGEAAKKAHDSNSGVRRGYQIPTEETLLEDVRDLLVQNGAENIDATFVASFLSIYDANWTSWLRDIEGETYYLNQNTYRELADILTATSLIDRDTLTGYFGFSSVNELDRYLSSDLNGLRELALLGQEIIARIDTGVDEWEEENLQPYKIQEAMKIYEEKMSDVLKRGRTPNTENILSTMNTALANAYRAYQNIVDGVISEMDSELDIMALLRVNHDTGSGALEDSSRNTLRNYGYIVASNLNEDSTPTNITDEIQRVKGYIREQELVVATGQPQPIVEKKDTPAPIITTEEKAPQERVVDNPAIPGTDVGARSTAVRTPDDTDTAAASETEIIPEETEPEITQVAIAQQSWTEDNDTMSYIERWVGRPMRDYIRISRDYQPLIDSAIEYMITGLDAITGGQFNNLSIESINSFEDGKYEDIIEMIANYLRYELEKYFDNRDAKEIGVLDRREYRALTEDFDEALDEIFQKTITRHGIYTHKGSSNSKYVSFIDALEELSSKIILETQPMPQGSTDPVIVARAETISLPTPIITIIEEATIDPTTQELIVDNPTVTVSIDTQTEDAYIEIEVYNKDTDVVIASDVVVNEGSPEQAWPVVLPEEGSYVIEATAVQIEADTQEEIRSENAYIQLRYEAKISDTVVATDLPEEVTTPEVVEESMPAITAQTSIEQIIIDRVPNDVIITTATFNFWEDVNRRFRTHITTVNSDLTEEAINTKALEATTMVIDVFEGLLPYIQTSEQNSGFENQLFVTGYKSDYSGQYDFGKDILQGFVNGVLLNYSMLGWNRPTNEAMTDCITWTLNHTSLYGNMFTKEIELLKQEFNTR